MSTVPIICVEDVEKTSKLLQKIFSWESQHGGSHFDNLVDHEGKSALWLHDLDVHEHARFKGVKQKSRGVGVSIYVLVSDLEKVYKSCKRSKLEIVEELFFNENAQFREFTIKIKEGYCFTVFERSSWVNL